MLHWEAIEERRIGGVPTFPTLGRVENPLPDLQKERHHDRVRSFVGGLEGVKGYLGRAASAEDRLDAGRPLATKFKQRWVTFALLTRALKGLPNLFIAIVGKLPANSIDLQA